MSNVIDLTERRRKAVVDKVCKQLAEDVPNAEAAPVVSVEEATPYERKRFDAMVVALDRLVDEHTSKLLAAGVAIMNAFEEASAEVVADAMVDLEANDYMRQLEEEDGDESA